mmetsp:Transcript_107265/g.201909  ORF Transcript_107265/g.201909 Transcript_107265/m.201909 type:complete len:248 (+) Transcript_107265:137-880(+)
MDKDLAISPKDGPNMRSCSWPNQPRSPHMPPPFCAVVHSDISLQSSRYLGVGCRAACCALDLSVGNFIAFASEISSRSALRSDVSASPRVRTTGLFRTGSNGCPQSLCFTRMCRSRTLESVSSSFCFFDTGSPLFSAGFGRKYRHTAVHCAFGLASIPLDASSPLTARGLFRNSPASLTISCGVIASVMGAEVSTKPTCLAAQESSITLLSGLKRTSFTLPAIPPCGPFQARSPRDRETKAKLPEGA